MNFWTSYLKHILTLFVCAFLISIIPVSHAEPLKITGPDGQYRQQNRQYGPTTKADTFWGIAHKIRPNKVSIYQVMAAIYEANPHAFASSNYNSLEAGMILLVPPVDKMLAIPVNVARERAEKDDKNWKQRTQPKKKITKLKPIKQQIAEAKAEPESPQKIKHLTALLEKEESKVISLTDELSRTQDELNMAKDDLEALKNKLAEFSGKVDLLEGALTETRQLNASLKAENKLLQDTMVLEKEEKPTNIWRSLLANPLMLTVIAVVPALLIFLLFYLILRRKQSSSGESYTEGKEPEPEPPSDLVEEVQPQEIDLEPVVQEENLGEIFEEVAVQLDDVEVDTRVDELISPEGMEKSDKEANLEDLWAEALDEQIEGKKISSDVEDLLNKLDGSTEENTSDAEVVEEELNELIDSVDFEPELYAVSAAESEQDPSEFFDEPIQEIASNELEEVEENNESEQLIEELPPIVDVNFEDEPAIVQQTAPEIDDESSVDDHEEVIQVISPEFDDSILEDNPDEVTQEVTAEIGGEVIEESFPEDDSTISANGIEFEAVELEAIEDNLETSPTLEVDENDSKLSASELNSMTETVSKETQAQQEAIAEVEPEQVEPVDDLDALIVEFDVEVPESRQNTMLSEPDVTANQATGSKFEGNNPEMSLADHFDKLKLQGDTTSNLNDAGEITKESQLEDVKEDLSVEKNEPVSSNIPDLNSAVPEPPSVEDGSMPPLNFEVDLNDDELFDSFAQVSDEIKNTEALLSSNLDELKKDSESEAASFEGDNMTVDEALAALDNEIDTDNIKPGKISNDALSSFQKENGYIDIDKLLNESSEESSETDPYKEVDFDLGDSKDLEGLYESNAMVDVDDVENSVNAKLDLARAYIEIDDKDSAKALLEEIQLDGNDRQKSEANELLSSIS